MSPACLLFSFLSVVSGLYPPLTDADLTALRTAIDGRDHQEEAFAVLVENAGRFTGALGDEPLRPNPDFDALLADPSAHRGDLCRLVGRLEQSSRLPPPFATVHEWFIRTDDDQPLAVYIVDLTMPDDEMFVPGVRVSVIARFYKRIDAVARDQRARSYPAFVGAQPARLVAASPAGSPTSGRIFLITALIAVLGMLFVVVMLFVRRARRSTQRLPSSRPEPGVDDERPLPEDPAEALAELRRRAQEDA